jgi:hypothetical protein
MTTLNYQGSREILSKLQAVHTRRWTFRLGAGIMAVATVAAGCVLVVSASAGYWRQGPPSALRWALLAGASAAILAAAAWFIVRAILWRENPAQLARFVEQRMPELRNELINSVLLADDRDQASAELVQQAISESVRTVRRLNISDSVSAAAVRKWAVAMGAVAVLLAAFAAAQPDAFQRGLREVLSPSGFDAPGAAGAVQLGKTEFIGVTPGHKVVFPGQPVSITAEVYNRSLGRIASKSGDLADRQVQAALADQAARMNARVLVRGRSEPAPMETANVDGHAERATFTCKLTGSAHESFDYAVEVGGCRYPKEADKFFTIHVVKIQRLDIVLAHPPYTKLPDRRIDNAGPEAALLEVPAGTSVALLTRLSASVRDNGPPTAAVQIEGQPPVHMAASNDDVQFRGSFTVNADARWRVEIRDASGRVRLTAPAESSRYYQIKAIPDRPPVVRFVAPNKDVSVAPGRTLPTRVLISDDYGLTEATFYAAREGQEAAPLHGYQVRSGRSGQFDYRLNVPAGYAPGSVMVYYATATDNRQLPGIGGPQTAQSSRFKVLVQDAAELEKEQARRYDELRRRLLEILKMQEAARVDTELCRRKLASVQAVTATGAGIVAAQEQIKTLLHKLAYEFPFDADMITVQQALAVLSRDDAQLAVDQAKVLASLKDLARRGGSCSAMAGAQDRIIDALRTLLAIMPSLAGKGAAAVKPGEDLPPDVKEKLRQLKNELEKFLESQKKVIESSDRLAKTPADNFTADDEKLLKELLNLQDSWEKFLNEAVTDFSKLAQQDFSNPSLLKELVSVKSDVTMAKDALSKKAVEIATAFEDNGVENAKSLTANIEKWLPDEPDRAKWSMEDPTGGQENVEQPELPTELEDLVGDLLEQEEDLFEQADDVTSKYAMSGDKGIGWDAMDGPISSMNAQGVTGNQLPNTSEMSGRSGEGRQGKSSGEFVEDKAVGKGGRRTPSRLTEEPFQKGQIDDRSTEPPGGATGGGKLSGAGAEGLEGPVPPPLANELKRLAGMQATLVNRAERIKVNFQVNDYANFKFLQAITLMNRVKSDLEHYRYRNALRARDETVGAIRQTKLLLAGKVDVTADQSQTMPKYVRDDIADAMKGDLPEKFREALQQYYKRLSEQAE